jgi:hypothetical protein
LPLHSKKHIRFTLNGEQTEVAFAPHKTLLEVLREDLNLTGTKHGCELGECGTCAVLVDGRSILSCLMLGLDAEDREVKTIEGMARRRRVASVTTNVCGSWRGAVWLLFARFFTGGGRVVEEVARIQRALRFRKHCREISVVAPGILKSTRLSSLPPRGCAVKKWNFPERVFTASNKISVDKKLNIVGKPFRKVDARAKCVDKRSSRTTSFCRACCSARCCVHICLTH